ncbi:glycosyltransferase family 4 protein [bacterium]|nr:glycosyltransferase family 4 protein [bacterium]
MKSNSKIKILYIGPIPPEVGGAAAGGVATYGWELATQAQEKGYDVYILTNVNSSFTKNGIKIICWPKLNKLLRGFYGEIFCLLNKKQIDSLDFLDIKEKINISYKAFFLKKILQEVRPNLIHVLHILDDVNFSLSILENRPPLVVTEHGVALLYKYKMHKMYGIRDKRLLLKRVEGVLKRANYIISVSQFSKSSLLNTFRFPSHAKIKSILNPINANKIPLLNRKEKKQELGLRNKKVILFCGTHLPIKRKRLDIFLKTVARDEYLRRNCKVLVITNDEAKIFAQNFIIEKNIDGLVLEYQPREKLAEYYNAADIFVMPSEQEGIGLVYYEALLAGVPVIGFFRSIEELENIVGIYIGEKFDAKEENEKDLAEKIKKVLNTDFDRKLIRKRVIERLSWDAKFNEFETVYREVLANKS